MKISGLINKAALDYQLNPRLLAAVILQESRGNPDALRFEKGFFKKYLSDKTRKTLIGHVGSHLETELFSRAFSFGLFQIMGNTAREHGFGEEFLTSLVKPELNVPLGAKILRGLMDKYHSLDEVLSRWNGGSNPDYPKEVIAHMDSGDCDRLLTGLV